MCGGGGYAGMTKALLIFLGWDPEKLYNIGGNWEYTGDNALELIVYSEEHGGTNFTPRGAPTTPSSTSTV